MFRVLTNIPYFWRITSGLRRGRGFRLRGGSGSDGAMTFAVSRF
jgi:hypothetical protein